MPGRSSRPRRTPVGGGWAVEAPARLGSGAMKAQIDLSIFASPTESFGFASGEPDCQARQAVSGCPLPDHAASVGDEAFRIRATASDISESSIGMSVL